MHKPMISTPIKTLVAFFFIVLLSTHSFAADEDLSEMVSGLAVSSINQKIEAIERLANSGHERAAPVLEAMLEGSLFELEDRIVIARSRSGSFFAIDAVTGEDVGNVEEDSLDKIAVTNRLRSVLRSALGTLNLLNPNETKRRAAINEVIKNRDSSIMESLEKALEKEQVPDLQRKLKIAKAAIELENSDEEETILQALKTIEDNPSPEMRSLLTIYVKDRTEAEADENIIAAAVKTLKQIESDLMLWEQVGNLYRGLSLGSVLLLAAVGLAITFGVMGVINMAHGEMVMLGAYSTFVVQQCFRAYMPGALDYSLFVAIPAAFLIACLVGIAIEQGIIRFLYGRPLETLLATWGLSLILQQSVRSVFGPTNREVSSPSWMSGALELESGLVITYNRFWIIIFSIAVVAGVAFIMRKTPFGLRMRAVTQNRSMAKSMGIRTGQIDALTFGLGSGIAGMAGVALSQIDNVSPNLGQSYIIDSFMVVVFGGVGNIMGTVVGALSLGVVNKFLEPLAGAVLAKILVLIAIILFIQKRPSGLFALKGRAVEN